MFALNSWPALLALALAAPLCAVAHDAASPPRPDDHAPIGVMADHTHRRGEVMLSYRYSVMGMSGNLAGTDRLSPDTIATQVPNRFSGLPGQPPTLRVVPVDMVMQMHMLGAMWAPTDALTLMAMVPWVRLHMNHITYSGGMGTARLGRFTTVNDGVGDMSLAALASIVNSSNERLHTSFALVAPTGENDATATVLAPNGMRPTLRLPYPMQIGSGSWAIKPGATYVRRHDRWSWGLQYAGTIYLDENDEGYSRGDLHQLNSWAARLVSPSVSVSLRLSAETEDDIAGIDANIVAPVQTADPWRQGGERLTVLAGANRQPRRASGHRLAAEYGYTVWQDLNGPQLERDARLVLGYQLSW